MKTTYKILFPAIAALILSSCVKDDLYDTPHPSTGAVTVTTDWSGISSAAAVPDSHDIVIEDFVQTVSESVNTLDHTFAPGQYEILLHNNPFGISVNGDNARVNATGTQGGVEAMPGYLFAGSRADLLIKADASTDITVRMMQYVRRLDIVLTVVEGDPLRINSVTADLSGVESGINIRSGERASQPATVSGNYTRSDKTLTVSFNLLGVVHAATPKLVTTLAFTDGHVQTVESDLSADLREFHDGVDPLTLSASLSLPVKSGMSATITDWHKADGGNIDAH